MVREIKASLLLLLEGRDVSWLTEESKAMAINKVRGANPPSLYGLNDALETRNSFADLLVSDPEAQVDTAAVQQHVHGLENARKYSTCTCTPCESFST